VVLPFVGFYYGIQYGKLVAVTSQAPAVVLSDEEIAAYYNDPAEWQADANNTSGGFSIAYPIDFDAWDNFPAASSTDWRMNAGGVPGVKYFTLTVPRAFEPQTNFAGTTLTVGGSKNSAALTQCMAPDQGGAPAEATSSTTINGIAFTIFHSSDAAAGNRYEPTSYRTLHAGECYAVEYTVHSGQIGNYPLSYDLQPFNEQNIDSLMQNIVGTFRFL
jgi:hypothetical protein